MDESAMFDDMRPNLQFYLEPQRTYHIRGLEVNNRWGFVGNRNAIALEQSIDKTGDSFRTLKIDDHQDQFKTRYLSFLATMAWMHEAVQERLFAPDFHRKCEVIENHNQTNFTPTIT
jgi:hypothetical protein